MGLIVLDASVLIAIVNSSDVHHVAAREAIDAGRDAGDRFVVPVVAYAEYMVGPSGDNSEALTFREGLIDAIPARVEPASREIGRRAAEIRARDGRRVRMPDALIIATAVVLGADRIVTADAGWPRQTVAVTVLKPR